MSQSVLGESKRILILTLSFGSGHVRAAQAVAQELRRQSPDADVRVVDALENCRAIFRACYVWPYWLMIRHAPALWSRFFNSRLKRMSGRTAPSWAFRQGCPQVFQMISEFKPDVLIAAEVAAGEMAALARRSGITEARLMSLITDHEAEPAWVQREVDHYLVPDSEVSAQLQSWRASAAKISVSGIPVDAVFSKPVDAQAVRACYNLSADWPIILLMGGGMGPTRMDHVAQQLIGAGEQERLHIIAVTGHDKSVKRRLRRLCATEAVTLTVLDWCDDVASLMQASAVLVTKPGGLTTAEAAICRLPVVMFDPLPGPEQRNAQKFAEAGAGVITRSTEETATAVLSVLNDERARRLMAVKARELARPLAASIIAAAALNVCGAEANDIKGRGHASV